MADFVSPNEEATADAQRALEESDRFWAEFDADLARFDEEWKALGDQ